MSSSSKKFVAVLLSAMIGLSSITAVSAFAAESGEPAAAAVEEVVAADAAEEVAADAVEAIGAEPTTEPAEPSETIAPTSAPVTEPAETTQPATEPTTKPTQPPTQPTTKPTQPTTKPTQPTTKPTQPTTVAPTTKPAPTVGALTGLKASNNKSNSLKLTWTKVNGASGYVIMMCNRSKGTTYKKLAAIKSNAANITKLSAATEYYFKVYAYITQDGKTYNGKDAVVKTATTPAAVKSLKKTTNKSDRITLTWAKTSGATGYVLYNAVGKKLATTKSTTYTFKNLKATTAYVYKVSAYVTKGGKNYIGDYSFINTATKPANVASFKKTSKATDSIKLSWKKVSGATGYYLYMCERDKTSKFKKIATVKANAVTVKKLKATTRYQFKVSAYVTAGGKVFEGATTLLKTATQPAKVQNFKKTGAASNQVKLSWSKVKGAAGYYLYANNKDKNTKFKKIATVKANSVTIKKIASGTAYRFRVAAYMKKDGVIYVGAASTVTTATQPSSLSGLKVTDQKSAIKLTWSKAKNVSGYKIFRKSQESGNKKVLYKTIKNAKTTTFTDKKVKSGRIYTYYVQAYRTANGNTYHGTAAKIKCTANFSVSGLSISTQLYKANLSWNKSPGAYKYIVYHSTDGKNWVRLGTTSGTSFKTKRLDAKKYYFQVVPVMDMNDSDFKGNGQIKSKYISDEIYGVSTGGSYVEISISQQHMWVYKNGKLAVETDVVTGNDDGEHNTPKGYHSMLSHMTDTNLVGETWDTHVDYWMAFTDSGCGIHDALWRDDSEYGGDTYQGNGSHGCVNTPYDAVAKVYANTSTGTPVIIY